MRRREFFTLLGGAAAAWPVVARGQQAAMPVVGVLEGADQGEQGLPAVQQGLRDAGYVDGRNVVIEYRSAQGRYDVLPALAAELVHRQVTIIIAISGTVSATVAKTATATIPIIFSNGGDPVKLGLVSSLNRPGGNVTGVSFLTNALGPKRVELLHELLPAADKIGFLVNPGNPNSQSETNDVQMAMRAYGLQLRTLSASSERDFETAYVTFAKEGGQALMTAADAYFLSERDQLVALATHHNIPTIYPQRAFVVGGGLASYGLSIKDANHLAGLYAARILKGEKPADLPVQQSTKFELAINLKTAKAFGITVPPKLLFTADEVIE